MRARYMGPGVDDGAAALDFRAAESGRLLLSLRFDVGGILKVEISSGRQEEA